MRNLAIAVLCFLAAPVAAQPCGSMSYTEEGMLSLQWGSAQAVGHHVEFAPYAGGVVAVVVAHRFGGQCLRTLPQSSGCSPLNVIGWAWSHQPLYLPPNTDVTLAGGLDNRWWQGPLRSLNAEPVGLQFHPGVPMRQDGLEGTHLGVMLFNQWGGIRGYADMQAVLLVPASGSW